MNPLAASAISLLKSITIVLDVVMFVVLLYFASGLRWRKEQDRASIVGFGIMIGTVVLSVVCILF